MAKIISFPCRERRKTVGEWVKEFETHYFNCRARSAKSETTYKGDYLAVFKKLPNNEWLDQELLITLIHTTKPDTRIRKRYCIALNALAKFAGLSLDTKGLKGCYSSKYVKARELPPDETIVTWYRNIPSPEWQWAYGMMATFGLRPHELFLVDFQRLEISGRAYVKDGKTGYRLVFPYYSEWVGDFRLRDINNPKVTGKCNSDLGSRVTRAFNRYKVPFPAYSLRHAWAIRTMLFGVDVSLAAQQMGHSVAVHTDLYHRWILEHQQEQAYEAVMKNTHRPRPPSTVETLPAFLREL